MLGYLHSQNPPIIYRDMKPDNIMLKPEGNLKVIDFGTHANIKRRLSDTTYLEPRVMPTGTARVSADRRTFRFML